MINPSIHSAGSKLSDASPLYLDDPQDRVGINTSSPGAQLEVQDKTTSSANAGGSLCLSANDGSPMGDSHRLGVIEFTGAEDSSNTQVVGARIEALTDAAWTNVENGTALYFYTTDGNASETNVLKIDSNKKSTFSGEVTVGTDLDVDGTTNLDNTDIDGTLTVDGTAVDVNATTTCAIDNSNTSNGVAINTATSGSPVSIGHTTSETTVNDNLTVTGDLTANGGFKSYIGLNENTNTSYTFVIEDAGKLVTSANGSDQVLTVPANSAVAFPIGTQINVLRKGSGNTTIHTAGTPNLYAADGALVLRVQYSSCTLIKVASDTWYVVGDLTT